MKPLHYESDVLIVGAGLAGIVTAIELLDAGKRVMIIDRDKAENIGGLGKWSFGGMFFVNSKTQQKAGIKDSVDLALKDWFSFAQFEEKEYWGKKWAEQYIHLCTPHSFDWLRKRGISFFPVVNWVERGLDHPGNTVPRFHIVWGTGHGLLKQMIGHLKGHKNVDKLDLLFDHRVGEIIMENGVIKGVKGRLEDKEQSFEVRASVSVIASGGINGSIEKVKANWYHTWGKPPEVILNGAHEYAIGDLHDATEAIRGNVVNLDKQWNYAAGIRHYKPRKENHGLSLVPCKSALWLNYEGRRIGPRPLVTAYDTRFLVERICQEPVKYSWQLLNQKIAHKEFAISGSEHNPLVRDKHFFRFIFQTLVTGNRKLVAKISDLCEDVIVAYSLEELAEKMNALTGEKHVQLELLREAVEQYDRQVDLGPGNFQDEQLQLIAKALEYRGDRARTCKFQKIADKKAMPFIAIREFILSRKSLGGIQTDLESRVLSQPDATGNQEPLEGLYAVGEAAGFGGGGLHGHRSLEGTFLGGCVITARVAAKSILGKKLS